MKVFSILNRKGGTGKTTTAVNLAAGIAMRGKRVLIIDGDPQANATLSLGIIPMKGMNSLGKLLIKRAKIEDVIMKTPVDYLDIIPSVEQLAKVTPTLLNAFRGEYRLKKMLEKVKDDYDYVIIDCAPYIGILTLNILIASSFVIIPIRNDFLSFQGFSQVTNTIDNVTEKRNPLLRVGGVLLTMVSSDRRVRAVPGNRFSVDDPEGKQIRSTLNEKVLKVDAGRYTSALFQTVIRFDQPLMEAPQHGRPVFTFAPDSAGAEDYGLLADEFVQRYG